MEEKEIIGTIADEAKDILDSVESLRKKVFDVVDDYKGDDLEELRKWRRLHKLLSDLTVDAIDIKSLVHTMIYK